MKCHIAQDLMPSYMDGLLSRETEQDVRQHLEECEGCRSLHAKLSASIDTAKPHAAKKEIDFLKKVRRKITKKVAAAFAVFILIVALLTYLFAIGSTVSKQDLVYTTSIVGDTWEMNLELTNGKALLVHTEPIYGDKDDKGFKPIVGVLVTPRELLPSPILESGNSSFMYGTTIDSFTKYNHKVVLRLADCDVVFTPSNYDAQQR
ncbi:zf-HC2 domain-containing protein [Paenibacillus sp. PR3]|uniref:Anti-sigma-W factor RsiW n=1 Tax=Paenibacillus terricola TaxID=2763503 RepID=A0ABR8N6E6_9BACL|nr:zf-HC2 domain-containing protein [Paenibacillus terricola]MBD3922039.1 zf-HC2 domain-containing protein [Paenibacillus terricola]